MTSYSDKLKKNLISEDICQSLENNEPQVSKNYQHNYQHNNQQNNYQQNYQHNNYQQKNYQSNYQQKNYQQKNYQNNCQQKNYQQNNYQKNNYQNNYQQNNYQQNNCQQKNYQQNNYQKNYQQNKYQLNQQNNNYKNNKIQTEVKKPFNKSSDPEAYYKYKITSNINYLKHLHLVSDFGKDKSILYKDIQLGLTTLNIITNIKSEIKTIKLENKTITEQLSEINDINNALNKNRFYYNFLFHGFDKTKIFDDEFVNQFINKLDGYINKIIDKIKIISTSIQKLNTKTGNDLTINSNSTYPLLSKIMWLDNTIDIEVIKELINICKPIDYNLLQKNMGENTFNSLKVAHKKNIINSDTYSDRLNMLLQVLDNFDLNICLKMVNGIISEITDQNFESKFMQMKILIKLFPIEITEEFTIKLIYNFSCGQFNENTFSICDNYINKVAFILGNIFTLYNSSLDIPRCYFKNFETNLIIDLEKYKSIIYDTLTNQMTELLKKCSDNFNVMYKCNIYSILQVLYSLSKYFSDAINILNNNLDMIDNSELHVDEKFELLTFSKYLTTNMIIKYYKTGQLNKKNVFKIIDTLLGKNYSIQDLENHINNNLDFKKNIINDNNNNNNCINVNNNINNDNCINDNNNNNTNTNISNEDDIKIQVLTEYNKTDIEDENNYEDIEYTITNIIKKQDPVLIFYNVLIELLEKNVDDNIINKILNIFNIKDKKNILKKAFNYANLNIDSPIINNKCEKILSYY